MTRPMISLFSGAGGLDLGLEDAGFETRVAVELEHTACETLRMNKSIGTQSPDWVEAWANKLMGDASTKSWLKEYMGERVKYLLEGAGKKKHLAHCEVIEGAIEDVTSKRILEAAGLAAGECELVCGGPPCQSFSRSGKQESVTDKRGQLFMDFVRVVSDVRPRWFLFENVKGLVQVKTTTWHYVCSECGNTAMPHFDPKQEVPREGDRAVPCEKCASKATSWGVRHGARGGALDIILNEFSRLGYTCYHKILNAAKYGVPQYRERLFIVGSRDDEAFKFPVPTHGPNENDESLFAEASQHFRTVWQTICEPKDSIHPVAKDDRNAVLWVKNLVRPHDEPVTWTLHEPAPTVGAHQGAKMAIAPKGVPLEQLARQQWHVLGRRQGDTKPVPVEHQYLSDLDLLRLQTFPSYWWLHGTRMQRAIQIGNAVPCALAEAMGRAIVAIESRPSRDNWSTGLRRWRRRRRTSGANCSAGPGCDRAADLVLAGVRDLVDPRPGAA